MLLFSSVYASRIVFLLVFFTSPSLLKGKKGPFHSLDALFFLTGDQLYGTEEYSDTKQY